MSDLEERPKCLVSRLLALFTGCDVGDANLFVAPGGFLREVVVGGFDRPSGDRSVEEGEKVVLPHPLSKEENVIKAWL